MQGVAGAHECAPDRETIECIRPDVLFPDACAYRVGTLGCIGVMEEEGMHITRGVSARVELQSRVKLNIWKAGQW